MSYPGKVPAYNVSDLKEMLSGHDANTQALYFPLEWAIRRIEALQDEVDLFARNFDKLEAFNAQQARERDALQAAHDDRAASMRETGEMVRSLYRPIIKLMRDEIQKLRHGYELDEKWRQGVLAQADSIAAERYEREKLL